MQEKMEKKKYVTPSLRNEGLELSDCVCNLPLSGNTDEILSKERDELDEEAELNNHSQENQYSLW